VNKDLIVFSYASDLWRVSVGIGRYPPPTDGATVTSPDFGFFNPDNRWDVENKGVTHIAAAGGGGDGQ
jgi:hypothetical protein